MRERIWSYSYSIWVLSESARGMVARRAERASAFRPSTTQRRVEDDLVLSQHVQVAALRSRQGVARVAECVLGAAGEGLSTGTDHQIEILLPRVRLAAAHRVARRLRLADRVGLAVVELCRALEFARLPSLRAFALFRGLGWGWVGEGQCGRLLHLALPQRLQLADFFRLHVG